MAKKDGKDGLWSGRNGRASIDNGETFQAGATMALGEKTTVRSGAKSSKTYLSPRRNTGSSQGGMKYSTPANPTKYAPKTLKPKKK